MDQFGTVNILLFSEFKNSNLNIQHVYIIKNTNMFNIKIKKKI